MATEHFQQGQVIFREGDKSQEAYFILSGQVEITLNTSHGVQSLAKLGAGEIFGEMAVLNDAPRSATATAKTDCVVVSLDAQQFQTAIQKMPEFGYISPTARSQMKRSSKYKRF